MTPRTFEEWWKENEASWIDGESDYLGIQAACERLWKDLSAPQQAGDGLTREALIAALNGAIDDTNVGQPNRYVSVQLLREVRGLLTAPRQPEEMGAGVRVGILGTSTTAPDAMAASAQQDDAARYEALERKHLGDIDKGTGIYAPKAEQQVSGFSCAKRAADPQNEFAACQQWCGDSQRCMTSFDTAKFFRHIEKILSMDVEQREQSTFGAGEATPELMAAIRMVSEIEAKARKAPAAQPDEREAFRDFIADANWSSSHEAAAKAWDAALEFARATQVQADAGASREQSTEGDQYASR